MKLRRITYLVIASLLVSCHSGIEGIYEKTEGHGGVFSNAFIEIFNLDDDTYLITAYDEDGKEEWEEEANYTKSSKLIWSDKFMPMEISFRHKNAELLAGNGTFGKYRFKKTKLSTVPKSSEVPDIVEDNQHKTSAIVGAEKPIFNELHRLKSPSDKLFSEAIRSLVGSYKLEEERDDECEFDVIRSSYASRIIIKEYTWTDPDTGERRTHKSDLEIYFQSANKPYVFIPGEEGRPTRFLVFDISNRTAAQYMAWCDDNGNAQYDNNGFCSSFYQTSNF